MGSSPIDRTILSRLWRNWQTRYFEGVVNESSYGFKSHQPHHLKTELRISILSFFVSAVRIWKQNFFPATLKFLGHSFDIAGERKYVERGEIYEHD